MKINYQVKDTYKNETVSAFFETVEDVENYAQKCNKNHKLFVLERTFTDDYENESMTCCDWLTNRVNKNFEFEKKKKQSIEGNRYGNIVVLNETEDRNSCGYILYRCKCDCGNIEFTTKSLLTSGKKTSCRECSYESRHKDLTGKKFGRLTVLEKYSRRGERPTKWLCLCDCGKKTIVAGYNLTYGKTKSCGCLIKDTLKGRYKQLKNNIDNKKYGSLTVLNKTDDIDTHGYVLYRCKCDCGNVIFATRQQLKCKKNLKCPECQAEENGLRDTRYIYFYLEKEQKL